MTREEAIRIAQGLITDFKCESETMVEFCNVVIEALKQEPSGDVISRQAVQDYIAKYLSQYLYNDVREAVEVIDEYIGELPPVNPQEPKTGHWIGHREHCENLGVMPSGLGAYEWCSNCDCGIDVREWHRNNYNYCPNCGCRMVKPQESEE